MFNSVSYQKVKKKPKRESRDMYFTWWDEKRDEK
jgi:hypothetical protein